MPRDWGGKRVEIKKLTVRQIDSLPPGKHSDGGGLWLHVGANGTKSWTVRVSAKGRRREPGIGSYPQVSLAEARRKAAEMRVDAKAGNDPVVERDRSDVPTFEQYARQVHEDLRDGWRNAKHDENWIRSLEKYAFPYIGPMRLDDITREDVITLLRKIWKETNETARRVRQRTSRVMESAIAYGWIDSDPAGTAITRALPNTARTAKHQRAIPYTEVPDALTKVANSKATDASKLCLTFVTLTAARSGEGSEARWDEIDLDSKIWTVPPERMKRGVRHRVPLPAQAITLLNAARNIDDGSGLVFPSPLKRGNPLSKSTLLNVLTKQKIDSSMHGFRTSFRQYALEKTDAPWEAAEIALAHHLGNPVSQSYIRDIEMLDDRRKLMQKWANHCIP